MKFLTAFFSLCMLCTHSFAQTDEPEEIPPYISSIQQSQQQQSGLINGQTAAIETLNAKVNELNAQMGALSSELREKEKNRKKLALESYSKAEQLRGQKQYQSAGIYFGNALAIEPDNMTILNAYTNTVLEWVSSRQAVGDYTSAQNTLNDYIRYLYTYSAGLPLKGADYLSSTFWTLTDYREKLGVEAAAWKKRQEIEERNELEKTIRAALSRPVGDTENELVKQFHELQGLYIKWQRTAPDGIQLSDALSKKQGLLADNIEALALLSQGEENIAASTKNTDAINSYYSTNDLYLTNQRLINLKPSLTDKTLMRINKFNADLNDLAGSITTGSAKTIWDNLNIKRRQEVTSAAKRAKTKEEAIKLWTAFAEDVSVEMTRTQNMEYAVNMRKLLGEIAQQTAALREEQMALYEKWSLKNIKIMYEDYNKEVGMLSGGKIAKDRIAAGMKDYLCPVDTRYLSVTSLKLYNDIYDFFNKELDREMRISTAIQFNDCKKKSMGDF